jgi:hypothetical protein
MHLRAAALMATSLAIALAVAGGSLGGVAWAKGKPTIKCSSISGNAGISFISGCGGNTGGSGSTPSLSFVDPVATIIWTNSKVTTFEWTGGEYVKKAKGCPAGQAESSRTGKVVSDTTGSTPVGAKIKVKLCDSFNQITQTPVETLPRGGKFKL